MDNKKLVFLKQLSTFVEDRSLLVEPNRKYDFRLSPNPPFTIFVEYRSAVRQSQVGNKISY